jgi:SET and MYND domain-containing protein
VILLPPRLPPLPLLPGDASCNVLSLPEAAALLAKEAANSFGLLAPLACQGRGEAGGRVLRGGAIYPTCALINHECLPNVARWVRLS